MVKSVTRRKFLRLSWRTLALGVGLGFGAERLVHGVPRQVQGATQATPWTSQWQNHEWTFVVDTKKCIGCGKCVKACKVENEVPLNEPVYRTWIERYQVSSEVRVDSPEGGIKGFPKETNQETKQEENGKNFFVPKLCNQCAKPSCVTVCPVGATYRTVDGVVLVDRERCIGCGYCVQACPYGARFIHPQLKVADKCTWCYHRISKGSQPACVHVCPTGARLFGDRKKPQEPLVQKLAQETVNVLKPSMGNEPQVFYLGLDKAVN
ncbi:4Fe-4S dicluster domain-containing protein [Paradesulfitobacterium aromaticivorans]